MAMIPVRTDSLDQPGAVAPLIAILRGIRPDEAIAVGEAAVSAGFRMVEVPLNSPDPFESIARLATILGGRALIGAGTVLSVAEVDEVARAGGRVVIAPNFNADVVRAAKERGLLAVPGIATPSEAFAALAAGADALKLFPAEILPPAAVRAMLAVLPKGTRLMPVGGIAPETIPPYLAAGARGFGIGSALYKPGTTAEAVHLAARGFVAAVASTAR
jgi:2-dehydro-3-deoxyphosphogalactonate aldolase